ncbi:MAG: hypothetical protein CSA86_01435 [Arcobacter sp.]|nr:MAG: hypothetical protein CSA86_01435 [Arcobacter sp.]
MIKFLFIFIFITHQLFALDLSHLLEDIKKESNKELVQEEKRLQKFINNKNKQKQMLKNIKKSLRVANQNTIKLKKTIDNNEKLLAKKESLLNLKVGDLGEMFGSVRQISADFLTNFQNSLSASQSPEKEAVFQKFANAKKLPNTDELKQFWHTILDEIIKSGQISKYSADVIQSDGEQKRKTVTKIGQFAAVSSGQYLSYNRDIQSLVELSTQPSKRVQNKALEFENADNKLMTILIDPTKGSLLSLLSMNPTIMDRIHQGGIVGYVILCLGLFGLLFALYKIILLAIAKFAINKQIKNISTPNQNNSLGKIAKTFYENKDKELSQLEVSMNEAIVIEVNKIKSGENFIKLLAAVAPLLGLLGTVTGMIATFQAITLFGTGDPKLMAGGISTALITTVLGLVTAIPLLFAYTYISSSSNKISSILEEQSIGLIAKNLK